MTLTHRSSLAAAGAARAAGLAKPARAFHRPVSSPGGSTDVLSRVIAERLGAELGQPVVIENRAGAAGNVGVAAVAKARPDGDTIGISTIEPFATQASLDRTLPFKLESGLTTRTPRWRRYEGLRGRLRRGGRSGLRPA
jgi:tripartite-type tricarboxylate transporter receptor subunit TctC